MDNLTLATSPGATSPWGNLTLEGVAGQACKDPPVSAATAVNILQRLKRFANKAGGGGIRISHLWHLSGNF